MKITFDHSKRSISNGLGISDERQEQLALIVFDHVEKSLLRKEEKTGTMVTECIEGVLQEAAVNRPEEFFWVGWLFCQRLESNRRDQLRLLSHLFKAVSETSEEDM